MNSDKLKKMQSQVRIGGKGTPRRKKKVVHSTQAKNEKKLQSCLKKLPLPVNTITNVEEVNMIKDDGSVIHFNNPHTQASLVSNTFIINGYCENKQITEMLPSILRQLSLDHRSQLKVSASSAATATDDDEEDVTDLVDNFEIACKAEVAKPEEPKADETLKESAAGKQEKIARNEDESAEKPMRRRMLRARRKR
ncbi:unnamed protein product [Ceutorhynchus assimilis]|uniref:Transcription factor BTF3 n=1 Tax=Ceutorhynchus assimilis TaxID=467358 RepID=A0A9P0DH83_9CUCU|nr:unnamed protein product [Ceutorhynchus assimilis]